MNLKKTNNSVTLTGTFDEVLDLLLLAHFTAENLSRNLPDDENREKFLDHFLDNTAKYKKLLDELKSQKATSDRQF